MINKKNRTACKACRLRKCLLVGMSKSGSRYGRRSNWFKIHCLLQEQQQAGAHPLKDKSSAIALWGESYKNLTTPPHFDTDSKVSPTEESILLNNNNVTKDRERSPNPVLPSYSAEAAAALWAARHSLFPMQLPHHPMPSIPMPFMPPFANFSPPTHSQSQRNILLPFMQTLNSSSSSSSPPARPNHHPPMMMSSSSSRSSEGSICSQSPSPNRNNQRNNDDVSPSTIRFTEKTETTVEKRSSLSSSSSPPSDKSPTNNNRLSAVNSIKVKNPPLLLDNPIEITNERVDDVASSKKIQTEEHSLALLRSLGPVQDQPMDLSVRVIEIKSRRKSSKVNHRIAKNEYHHHHRDDDKNNESSGEEGDVVNDVKNDVLDSIENNDENFNKRKNPLDLTKSTKLEI